MAFNEFTQETMPTQTRINEAAGGGPWMGLNPSTGKWENIVQYNDYTNVDNPRLGLQGWESENTGVDLAAGGGGYITGITRDDNGFGDAFGDFISGAAPFIGLGALGVGLGGGFDWSSLFNGAAGGADMAFGGESALQGSSYLGGGSDVLFGGAGTDTLGGGMDFPYNTDSMNWATDGGGANYASPLTEAPGGIFDKIKNIPGGSNILKSLFGGNSNSGSYQFPFANILGSLLEAYGQKQYGNDLKGYLNKSLEYADPFHNERPGYQTQFRNLTSNPSNFFRDSAIANAINFEDQATSRKLASQGYNMSGNFANDVSQARMREAFKQYMPYTDMIGTAAGYKLNQGSSGDIAARGGQAIAGSNQAYLAGLGSAFDTLNRGSQPSYLQQIFGTQSNQNLGQALGLA